MKKTNVLFMIWGVIVVIVIALLTTLGFMLKSKNGDYEKLEQKLLESAQKYVDNRFLYPEDGEELKISSSDLIESTLLDDLKVNDDKCVGYVIITKDTVFNYKPFIKCKNYTTKGYK